MKCIINGKLILADRIIEGYTLYFNESIMKIEKTSLLDTENGLEIIDAKGHFVSAGFIDLHIHGSGGADVMDATPEALETLSVTLLQTGTTSFLATTMTMSSEAIESALKNISQYASSVTGSQILGVHLEGPFINPLKHGAQDKQFIQKPNMELIREYISLIKMITIASEVDQSEVFIKQLQKEYPHIILSIGHSNASYEETQKSFRWGVSHATHLFNAMNPYHHREPGIVGAVFDSDITCDVIADLVHTHPHMLELVYKMKKEKLILITDAMRAGCMKCGTYDLGGRTVEVSDGEALLEDGTLAGSVLKMNEAMANMLQHTSMSRTEIVASATKRPAQKLGLKKGELKKGYDADIVIFDEDFSIISTIIAGEVKYRSV